MQVLSLPEDKDNYFVILQLTTFIKWGENLKKQQIGKVQVFALTQQHTVYRFILEHGPINQDFHTMDKSRHNYCGIVPN